MIEQLTFTQIKILRRLLELNREIPRKELAEYLGVTSSALNLPINVMRGELINVCQAKGRGNSHVISLTQRGSDLINALDTRL